MYITANKGADFKELKGIGFFTLANKNNVSIKITNYGLRILTLNVPDKNGHIEDVVLGFDKLDDYLTESGQYFGCIIGQYANRIENGRFILNGKKIQLDKNEKGNHLHGGCYGYHNVIWEVSAVSHNKLNFQYTFKESETGYPGTTKVEVFYELTENNEFIITYEAKSDKDTIISLTNHAYFNLKGEGNGTIEDHFVKINANHYLSINESCIPNEIQEVDSLPLDLRDSTELKDVLRSEFSQITLANGLDHCYVLKKELNNHLNYTATVEDKSSGRILNVYTTEPGVQLYTGNFLDGTLVGKSQKAYQKYAGLCIETQQFPNAPNEKEFPSPVLKASKKYTSTTVYQFLVNNQIKPLQE
ncbi:aldose 1-epimerase [Tenacibaculum sp. MAR_2009_124]|uniref:aldose epimerase family protein n=1 Tax=Tenacibaculum sp. MAR_2009_124 TaxID=1250059 RepID=UPI000899F0A0|nr:aldose epimerase family protein [Tenacibaculum sp. MAR_2009_124]SED13773.1 aldose 1-epimerase [Tenacibaculum sp. MAR_2009_124]